MKATNNTRKRKSSERKVEAWGLLADGESVTSVASKTGINKGTISRWKRSAAFQIWQSERQGGDIVPVVYRTSGAPAVEPAPEIRAKFLRTLRLTGRLDVACCWSGATKEMAVQWIIGGDLEVVQAHAEPFLRVAQVVRNLMEGRDAQGKPIDVKPVDQLRAAEKYLNLMDWRHDVPHLRVDINAGSAAIEMAQGNTKTPLAIMIESMRDDLHQTAITRGNDGTR